MLPFSTHPHGKLLLSAEYAVLDGAVALAVPVRFGQLFGAKTASESGLSWTSLDERDNPWFTARFDLPGLALLESSDPAVAQTLLDLLHACRRLQPEFLTAENAVAVETRLDFPRAWGLGTSSTLIAALGKWSGADPYQLLFDTLGGSGYDIACAYAESPVVYQLDEGVPMVEPIRWDPPFAERLYFVYLGKKQDSREGIRRYRALPSGKSDLVETLSAITFHLTEAHSLETFAALLDEHEQIVSQALDLPRAQTLHFPGYPGVIKSLGAWGGDFVLATGLDTDEQTRAWFHKRGFETVLGWEEMVG